MFNTGFINARSFELTPNSGRLLENVVFVYFGDLHLKSKAAKSCFRCMLSTAPKYLLHPLRGHVTPIGAEEDGPKQSLLQTLSKLNSRFEMMLFYLLFIIFVL
jgi:hypothetical protein